MCRLAAVDSRVRVLLVTGAGKAFCSGGNFKAFGACDVDDKLAEQCRDQAEWDDVEVRTQRFRFGSEATKLLHEMGKPTIAMINGSVAGAGLALAAACDFRFASQDATFHPGYLKNGLSPDFGLSWFLTRIVGAAVAKDMLLLRDRIDAAEALSLGFVNRVFPTDMLEEEVMSVVRRLVDSPHIAVHYTKLVINTAQSRSLEDTLEIEARNLARCFQLRSQSPKLP